MQSDFEEMKTKDEKMTMIKSLKSISTANQYLLQVLLSTAPPRAGSGACGVTRVSQHRARSIILEHYYRFGFCDLNGNKSRVNLDNVSFLNGVLSMYKLRIHACICYLNIFLNLQLWVFDTPHLREECGREVEDSAAEQELGCGTFQKFSQEGL